MNTKPFYESKTLWFNVLTGIVIVATLFGYTPNQQVAGTITTVLAALSPFINIYLRTQTTTGISVASSKKPV